jgi:RNA polymerase sigma factor (sigma-70 family)
MNYSTSIYVQVAENLSGSMTEAELIHGCVKQDRACQKLLYERYHGKMMAVCLRYAKNRDEAKDIMNEAFMKVYGNLRNFGHTGSFEGWVRRIMVNTAIDHLRKNRHEYLIVNTVYANHVAVTRAEEVDDEDIFKDIRQEDIIRAIQELSPAYRTVFNLFVMEEFTHKEIAEKLDISEGTSKSNLAKAKFNLKKNLSQFISKAKDDK